MVPDSWEKFLQWKCDFVLELVQQVELQLYCPLLGLKPHSSV